MKQEITPGLGVKSELPASTLNLSQNDQLYQDHKAIVSTQHQEYTDDISMASSNEYNGLYIFSIKFLTLLGIQNLPVYLERDDLKREITI